MLSTLLLLALVILLIWLWFSWMRVRTFWSRRGVPSNPPHPIMGSLTFLQKKNPGEWMVEMYNQFKSPYVGIWLFRRPALVINDPEIAKRVLVKDSDVWRNRFLSSGSSDPIGGLNIFTVNVALNSEEFDAGMEHITKISDSEDSTFSLVGRAAAPDPTWSWVRRRLTPIFTSSRLRGMQPLLAAKSSELVERIKECRQQTMKIDIRNVYADYTTDIIGMNAFGVDSNATLTGDSAMRHVTKDFQIYSVLRGMAWACIFFYPSLVDIFRFSFFPKNTTNYFRKIFYKVVEQRGGWNSEPGQKDLLDALIKFKQDAIKNKEEVSDDLLIAQAAIMLQGGFDTTSGTLTFLTYELAHQPKLQEKLYVELTELQKKFGELNTTVLTDAPFMNAIIKETLRQYPPMGWLDRICSKNYKIDDKLTIPAGTPVYVNAVGIQMDSKYFPDPEKFDPDRFLPENEQNIEPYTYMPFGEGPRACIGNRFAQVSMRAALATLTMNFKYRPLPGAKKPRQIELERKGLFLLPGEILYLEFIPRT